MPRYTPASLATQTLMDATPGRGRAVSNASNGVLRVLTPVSLVIQPGGQEPIGLNVAEQAITGVWDPIGLSGVPSGGCNATECPEGAGHGAAANHHYTVAFRRQIAANDTAWGMFWKRIPGTNVKILETEVRPKLGSRRASTGNVSLVAIKTHDPQGPEDVLFFGGIGWDVRSDVPPLLTSTMPYDLTLVDGEFPYVHSTGEGEFETPATAVDAKGIEQTVEAGDILFRMANERVDDDQVSITALIQVWEA